MKRESDVVAVVQSEELPRKRKKLIGIGLNGTKGEWWRVATQEGDCVMGRIIIKGVNYTEIWFRNKKTQKETVHFNMIAKERKPKDCGVWMHGKRQLDYECMQDYGFSARKNAEDRLKDLGMK